MDPNQDRAVQAAFDGYVPAAEVAELRAEIGRLRAVLESIAVQEDILPIEAKYVARIAKKSLGVDEKQERTERR